MTFVPRHRPSASEPGVGSGHPASGLLRDLRGLSTIEYMLILVLVGAVSLVAWRTLGSHANCALAEVQHLFAEKLGVEASPVPEQCRSELDAEDDAEGSAVAGSEDGTARTVDDRARGGSSGKSGAKPGGAAAGGSKPSALSPAEALTRDVLAIMCPKDKAFLQDMKAHGVKITAYDRIYFDDPYYDGKKWTTKRFEAGGTTSGTEINMIRSSSAAENAATIYHEGVHTGQPAMAWRDKEYDAYIQEDQWRISHSMPPHAPSFRKRDPAGNETTDAAAVRAFVDKEYPGVTAAPASGGAPEQVIGRTPKGLAKVQRADGSVYTRPPKKGDSFSGPETTVPKGGIPIDVDKLQCP